MAQIAQLVCIRIQHIQPAIYRVFIAAQEGQAASLWRLGYRADHRQVRGWGVNQAHIFQVKPV